MMGTTSSITMQSLGDRTTRAGCRCENKVFVCFCLSRSGPPAFVRGVHNLKRYCVTVYRSILTVFIFFRRDIAFRYTIEILFSSLDDATIFMKVRSKFAKSPKIGVSVCAPHFVYISEIFSKTIPP